MPNKAIDYIFEASWEVCNKVGGIYTVLSTKAKNLQKQHKDHIIFIGPDVWTQDNPSPDFIESKTILKKWRESALLPEGVSVRVGRWDIPGKPIAILVKFEALYA
ncbi:MAG: glycosyl transferase, partial [Muribaculaceae bacterium]|nr:glycosyl transferase [Muribaculaceae bacterium]